ncbi:MAG: alpha/beta hydrolase [Microbacterium gubbeenense]
MTDAPANVTSAAPPRLTAEEFEAATRAAGLPGGIEQDSRLGETIQRYAVLAQSLPGPDQPPMTPTEGQSEEEWLRAVAEARAAHNAYAVRAHEVSRAAMREWFGGETDGILAWQSPTNVALPAAEDVEIETDASAIASTVNGYPEFVHAATTLKAADARWPVPVRIHKPAEGDESAPVIIEFHGGAFWMGDGECLRTFADPYARYMASRAGAVVLTVDYRLVPEHSYPTPILDALAVLDWVRENAARLHVDPARIVLAGTSSGGNIAAVAAVVDSTREVEHRLAGTSLTVPALDVTEFGSFYSSTPERRAVRAALLYRYTNGVPASAPTVSPAIHPIPNGFPPSVIVTSEFDEVASGSTIWAAGLRDASVPVRHGEFPMTHTLGHPSDDRHMREFLAAGIEWLLEGASEDD